MPANGWRKRQIMSKSDGVHEEGGVCARCGGLVFDPVIPQKRHEWEPLTDEQIKQILDDCDNGEEDAEYALAFARAIEAAHGIKEKNT